MDLEMEICFEEREIEGALLMKRQGDGSDVMEYIGEDTRLGKIKGYVLMGFSE